MHVQELTLTNVRQFEDDSFNFKPGFNLVVGENGKGKTTSALGIVLRAIGYDMKVCLIQFMKGDMHAGEYEA